MADDALDVAKRFFAAIEKGDTETVRSIYHPDVVVWHNTDNIEKTREENLGTLAWAIENIEGLRYEDVRLQRTERGFVQQHVCRGKKRDTGAEMVLPAVVVAEVKGATITRLDEYFDSSQAPEGVPEIER